MRTSQLLTTCAILLAGTACYHVTVESGKTPGTQVIEEPWAAAFVYGLVPPHTVQTASRCPSGVARVETMQSFLNGLVAGLTLGIFTPWTIKVTCAASNAGEPRSTHELAVRLDASTGVYVAVFGSAADRAMQDGAPVYVSITAPSAP
jgi:Bor protein